MPPLLKFKTLKFMETTTPDLFLHNRRTWVAWEPFDLIKGGSYRITEIYENAYSPTVFLYDNYDSIHLCKTTLSSFDECVELLEDFVKLIEKSKKFQSKSNFPRFSAITKPKFWNSNNVSKTKYPLIAVVAHNKHKVIGDGEKMLWNIPNDLKRVRELTINKPLIMGRKTFESIGKVLDNRLSIILTHNRNYKVNDDRVKIAHDPDEALRVAEEYIDGKELIVDGKFNRPRNIIIFGGSSIYHEYFDKINEIKLTEVSDYNKEGVKFPFYNLGGWTRYISEWHPSDDKTPSYTFSTLKRAGYYG